MESPRSGRVAGKTTIITGAAKGIGAGCAAVFAREGACLILADTDEPNLRQLASRLRDGGAEVYPEVIDIADEAQVIRLIARAEEVGGKLDILVNNAGVILLHTIEETSMDEWDSTMRVNMRGSFMVAKHAVMAMKRGGGGAIVNTSSISSLVGMREQAAYAPSKAYVHEMTKQLALDYAPYNIRVNAVCPGTIITAVVEQLLVTNPAMIERLKEANPIKRLGTPEEVGWAVLFLASDEASFVTGAYLAVDGGYTAQ